METEPDGPEKNEKHDKMKHNMENMTVMKLQLYLHDTRIHCVLFVCVFIVFMFD